MDRRFYKYLTRNISLVMPVVAISASLLALTAFFLEDFGSSSTLPILIGIIASVAGAAIAYAFAMAAKMVSRALPSVFISYSHEDTDFVDQLSEALREVDVNPIVDRLELKVGDDIRSAVDNMIDRSDYFLFVISSNSAKSDWAKKEIEQATKREKTILPIVLDIDAIPESLSGVYYADFTGEFLDGMTQLLKTFK